MAHARTEGFDPERLEPCDYQEIADGNRGLPVATADITRGDYWACWLGGVAAHRVREIIHLRYAACVCLHLIPDLGTKRRLSSRHVPFTVQLTWNNRRISVFTRASVHRWSAQPEQPAVESIDGDASVSTPMPPTAVTTNSARTRNRTACSGHGSDCLPPAGTTPAPAPPGTVNPPGPATT